ncbi:DNA glycosylase AlkZ-like family protein [Brevibacterium sp. CFH 10365]|uniref:DNA glycosylase AlkZ-like family protein n=1 Tax=Brevibacterium sp. CFH 10365 TaxID=2585207 RepID=UPI001266466C|nr:crosslink repair DNA glycosylase YcaQ family protein [Brevibacterium sp. CFH 10365]
MSAPLAVIRDQILDYRRHASGLDERCDLDSDTVRKAAWAGLQDSVPKSALLSLTARLQGVSADTWTAPELEQVWGPRNTTYVIASSDRAVFTLGRHPLEARAQKRATQLADQLETFLSGRTLTYREAGQAIGVHPNALRYAATTGRVLIRWEGFGPPLVRTVPQPEISPEDARKDLLRRHLHILGPGTVESFAAWAGIQTRAAQIAFNDLHDELIPVRTALGDAWIAASDEDDLRSTPSQPAPARLLPSGDNYLLLWGEDRSLVVPDAPLRECLWTPRVWPGAVLVDGEVVGTWRRSRNTVTITAWKRLSESRRHSVAAEAEEFPLPTASEGVRVVWDGENAAQP